jgi:hypothetical protein
MNGIGLALNQALQLHRDGSATRRARLAFERVLAP